MPWHHAVLGELQYIASVPWAHTETQNVALTAKARHRIIVDRRWYV